jgi:hypothetical protein
MDENNYEDSFYVLSRDSYWLGLLVDAWKVVGWPRCRLPLVAVLSRLGGAQCDFQQLELPRSTY